MDRVEVGAIHADLTAKEGLNLTHAKILAENTKASLIGPQKNGPFDISLEDAVQWLSLPDPDGRSNAKIVTPTCPVAKPGHEADLKKRILTKLYNARPAWLDLVHNELDKSVVAACWR